MFRLAAVIYILLSATLAGIFIVAALTVGMDTAQPIIYAAVAGFAVALPVSWIVAKQING
ncbi:CTP synthetase [Aliiroseovarius sp. S1339]|uniref:CTP synthetase n=1 Tax=Aliiroseovarius sp. S1339 TaxID=2936990 RepID=UPI0020C11929|nr:CTP synthetase [Aliiroseovarius sp. S1339]MCK8465357.1 CTP synthetase [Aliiroseovarius sp. S1339]